MSAEIDDIYAELTSFDGDGGSSGTITGMKVYDGHSYFITVRLSDIFGAELTEVDDPETGEPRRGIFIPFRNSGLTVTPKKNVLLVCKAELAQVVSSKYTHLLTQIADKNIQIERQKLGFKSGFVGHMRPVGPKPLKKRKK